MPLQMLTTWVSALHPQNMLEQLLIHQPQDPITFMIDHLHRDNDNGEHACPFPSPLPSPSSPSPGGAGRLGRTLSCCVWREVRMGWGEVLTIWAGG